MVLCAALTENPKGGSHYGISENSTSGAWWAKKIHGINRDHCRRCGHPVVVRHAPVKWEPWQEDFCAGKLSNLTRKPSIDLKQCQKMENREVSAWEKMRMMRDMLNVLGFTHVLILDCDAVMNHMRRDTMSEMAQLLEQESNPSRSRQILLISEDCRGGDGPDGKGTGLNAGMMFAKNTGLTRQLFADMARANKLGPAWSGPGPWCATHERACLESWQTWKKRRSDSAYPGLNKAILKASSLHFGMNPCIWFDCTLEKFPNIPRYEHSESRHHACHHCNGLRVPPGNLTKGRSVGCSSRCDLDVNSSENGIVHIMGDSRSYIDYLLPMLPHD
ncbi:unnamed protein product [Prorocentrum cordatum]|uniref:Uncharacterized protein n=1 Tax=Prorocentrum cordatum TaxID=2364126 RepID=A0ABN9WXI7_9DINO|nr:unnamed protein product [Polarella glacialis]